MRINNRRADEAKPALLEILAECVGFERGRRNLPHLLPPVALGSSSDELPAIGVKTFELFLNCEQRPRVANRGFDFHPVSNDRRIPRELLNSFLGISRYFFGIEFVEGAAIALPFFEHNRPAESRLRPFEHQKLEVFAVVMHRHSPFTIVILEHHRIVGAGPRTSFGDHKLNALRHRVSEILENTAQSLQAQCHPS